MNQLKNDLKDAIVEEVRHEPFARKVNESTGEILEGYRAYIKFGFEVNAKNLDQAKEMILHEATKYFNSILESK